MTPPGTPLDEPAHDSPARSGRPDDWDERAEEIVRVITEIAAGHWDARAYVSAEGNMKDALAAGVNFLSEELAAAMGELEERVAERTQELEAANAELERRSLHDPLTGLGNRVLLWDRLAHRLRLADRRADPFALLYLDIDGFKHVNDLEGHAGGDRLLVSVAEAIRNVLRSGDTAARVGGDEFVVLLDQVSSTDDALALATRLHASLRERGVKDGEGRPITVSIGLVIGSAQRTTPDAVIGAADAAMYEAKALGGGRCVMHEDPTPEPAQHGTDR